MVPGTFWVGGLFCHPSSCHFHRHGALRLPIPHLSSAPATSTDTVAVCLPIPPNTQPLLSFSLLVFTVVEHPAPNRGDSYWSRSLAWQDPSASAGLPLPLWTCRISSPSQSRILWLAAAGQSKRQGVGRQDQRRAGATSAAASGAPWRWCRWFQTRSTTVEICLRKALFHSSLCCNQGHPKRRAK